MPKWTSPLFTDIRNALGTSVVFSIWKGRPYFRSWVKPANPRTNDQTANRDWMAKAVARYQDTVIVDALDPSHTAVWNAAALPYSISGYNLFCKYARMTSISVPATASGSGTANITVTYSLGIPASKAKIAYEKSGTWTLVDQALESGVGKTKSVSVSASGTYNFWIIDTSVLESGDTTPQDYQAVSNWSMPAAPPLDAVVAAQCVVTVS